VSQIYYSSKLGAASIFIESVKLACFHKNTTQNILGLIHKLYKISVQNCMPTVIVFYSKEVTRRCCRFGYLFIVKIGPFMKGFDYAKKSIPPSSACVLLRCITGFDSAVLTEERLTALTSRRERCARAKRRIGRT
jgi:hypothetical protein